MGSVVLMGDFNCHVNSRHFRKSLDSRDKLFNTFLYDNSLTTVTPLDLCGGAPVSFESNRGRSIIDNIILSTDDINSISYCAIVEDNSLPYSNHRAVRCSLTFPIIPRQAFCPLKNYVNWSKVSLSQKEAYRSSLDFDVGLEALLTFGHPIHLRH